MKGVNPRSGFLKCGRKFVRKCRSLPGDNCGRSPTNIRDKEEGITDTRTIGYNEEIHFGPAICSLAVWGREIFDEEERLRDPQKSFIPFEELMIADVDGSPLRIIGDYIVDEDHDIEESLAEALDEAHPEFIPQLKPGTIRVWHYPHPWGPEGPDGSGLFFGNQGKISTDRGEVTVVYKRKKTLPVKPEPGKKGPRMPNPQTPPKRDLDVLGSLLHSKRMPQLHQLAMLAKR